MGPPGKRVLADTWYAEALSDVCESVHALLAARYPTWLVRLAEQSGLVRGALTFWLGRSYDSIVTAANASGSWTLLLLEALFRGHAGRVVLLEFIRGRPSGWRRLIHPAWLALVERPILKAGMRAGHVLTVWERDQYSRVYGLPKSRFRVIAWPLRWRDDTFPKRSSDRGTTMVVASGRAACDWDTLFRAAEGRTWPLTVICDKSELQRVRRLSAGTRARILCDVPQEAHQQLVESALVYVLSLRDNGFSAGHIRLMNATRAGVPVVATQTRGLHGYVFHDETALLVEPEDYMNLRASIESLLDHEDRRVQLSARAFERAGDWTFEQYLCSIRAFLRENRC